MPANDPVTQTPTDAPMPDGHPYDVSAEAAGREMWEFQLDWAARHGLTDIQYLWIIGRMLQERLRAMSPADRDAYMRQRRPAT